jgi:hypothetical protein
LGDPDSLILLGFLVFPVSHLPEIQAQHSKVVISIDTGIWEVLRVVNFRVDPGALVIGVVNLPWLPLALQNRKEPGKWR